MGIGEIVLLCVILCSHIGGYQYFLGTCSLQLKDYVQI
jgi:hypothetical protein